jgi:hypothetical protein
VLIARCAKWIVRGFFDKDAVSVGDDAAGTEMVRVVVTDAQSGVGNFQFSRNISLSKNG